RHEHEVTGAELGPLAKHPLNERDGLLGRAEMGHAGLARATHAAPEVDEAANRRSEVGPRQLAVRPVVAARLPTLVPEQPRARIGQMGGEVVRAPDDEPRVAEQVRGIERAVVARHGGPVPAPGSAPTTDQTPAPRSPWLPTAPPLRTVE